MTVSPRVCGGCADSFSRIPKICRCSCWWISSPPARHPARAACSGFAAATIGCPSPGGSPARTVAAQRRRPSHSASRRRRRRDDRRRRIAARDRGAVLRRDATCNNATGRTSSNRPLPDDQHRAIQTLGYGRATRMMLQFSKRFWRKAQRPSAFGTDLLTGAVWDGERGTARPGRHLDAACWRTRIG